jgi:hypothetical protein
MNLLEAHYLMIERYKKIINETDNQDFDKDYWMNFCDTALTLQNTDKLSRWVGFLQGNLFQFKIIDIDEERNYSREIYKPIYIKNGMDSKTVEVKK